VHVDGEELLSVRSCPGCDKWLAGADPSTIGRIDATRVEAAGGRTP